MKDRKPIQVDKDIHDALKRHCNDNGLVLKFFVEKLILDKLNEHGNSISSQKKK